MGRSSRWKRGRKRRDRQFEAGRIGGVRIGGVRIIGVRIGRDLLVVAFRMLEWKEWNRRTNGWMGVDRERIGRAEKRIVLGGTP